MTPEEYAALSPEEREAVYRAASVEERRVLGFPRLAPLHPYSWDGSPVAVWEFVRNQTPRWWHVWLLADDCTRRVRLSDRIESRIARTWPSASPGIRLERETAALERRGRQIELRRQRILHDRIEPRVRAAVASEQVIARATADDGSEIVVPRRLASQMRVDPMASTLSLAGGGPVWRGVTLELTDTARAALTSGSSPPLAADRAPQRKDDAELLQLVRDGIARGDSVRAAVLKHAGPEVRSEQEQEALYRRINRKIRDGEDR